MANKKISAYFKDYPNSPECAETSDGTLFHLESDAKNHAESLEDKSVKIHKKADGRQFAESADEEVVIGSFEPTEDGAPDDETPDPVQVAEQIQEPTQELKAPAKKKGHKAK
jgi:hypothetical protein